MTAWKVVLAVTSDATIALSRLVMARPDGVTWYRRRSQLMLTVNVYADSQLAAERKAVDVVTSTQVEASVIKSKLI